MEKDVTGLGVARLVPHAEGRAELIRCLRWPGERKYAAPLRAKRLCAVLDRLAARLDAWSADPANADAPIEEVVIDGRWPDDGRDSYGAWPHMDVPLAIVVERDDAPFSLSARLAEVFADLAQAGEEDTFCLGIEVVERAERERVLALHPDDPFRVGIPVLTRTPTA